jgi:hypothetical protein
MTCEDFLGKIQALIARTAIDQKFRTAFVADPVEVMKSTTGSDLTQDEIDALQAIRQDLQKYDKDLLLESEDAMKWAIGLILTSIARAQKKDWTVKVTSIPKKCLPPVKKGWNLRTTSIVKKSLTDSKLKITSIPKHAARKKTKAGKTVTKKRGR